MASFVELLIEALKTCPCCGWERSRTNGPEDGIPDIYIHESVFQCGAVAFIEPDGTLGVSQPCPGPLTEELEEIEDRVREDFEGTA